MQTTKPEALCCWLASSESGFATDPPNQVLVVIFGRPADLNSMVRIYVYFAVLTHEKFCIIEKL